MNHSDPMPPRPSMSETLWVTALLCIFLGVGFIKAYKLPISLDTWWDEILFVDPAANLYFGQGFTSSAWFAQSKDEFWAGYPPLYSFLLYLWMQIFGFSLGVARSLNSFLAVLSALSLWKALTRLNLVTSAFWRVAVLVVLLVVANEAFNFRPGRPDVLMVVLATTTFLAYSVQAKPLRYLCMTCICAIVPFAGLGLIAFAIIFSTLVFIYLKRLFLREIIAIIVGLAIGSLGLFSFYVANGVWQDFIASTLTNSSLSSSQGTVLEKFFANLFLGFTSGYRGRWFLIFSSSLVIYKLIRKEFKLQSLHSFGAVAALTIPFAMRTSGAYPLYYDWMTCLPVAVCIFSEIPRPEDFFVQRRLRSLLPGCLVVFLLFSPPLGLLNFLHHSRALDYSVVEKFVSENIKQTDWIMSDPLTYYAAKPKAEVVFHPFYLQEISEEEREKISVIITKPIFSPELSFEKDGFEAISSKLGGSWSDTGQSLTLQSVKSRFSPERIELRVYRRTAGI